ncbi:MAG: hypothetical protein JO304_03740 [Solirubrobacterales bacterium]|nr:hypothetical protein [Solirubrobacterales bacterium]
MSTTHVKRELVPMRDEDEGAHEYTETWCKGGETGHVELSSGGRVRYLRVGRGGHVEMVAPSSGDR